MNKIAPDAASSIGNSIIELTILRLILILYTVGTKRALQEKENTPARPNSNVERSQPSEVKNIDSVKKGVTPGLDREDDPHKVI